jgi:hypothetical protein
VNKPNAIRVVGIVLFLLGLVLLGETAWQLIAERDSMVRTLYPMTSNVRGAGYVVGGVGLMALRKWAVPALVLILAACRSLELYAWRGWIDENGDSVVRIPTGEVVVIGLLVVIGTWGWSTLRWGRSSNPTGNENG